MSEKTMIINRKAFPKIHDVKTSVTQSLDIKDRYEEIVDSLLLYLKQMREGAIILADDKTNKLTEAITRVEDRRNNNKRYSIRRMVNRDEADKAWMITARRR
jgi:hypothetical protein